MWAILLILAVNLVSAWATDYYLLVEDPDVYSPCTDGPPGSISVNDAFDMDNMVFDQDEDGIHISGNATVKWSLPRTDRISVNIPLLKKKDYGTQSDFNFRPASVLCITPGEPGSLLL